MKLSRTRWTIANATLNSRWSTVRRSQTRRSKGKRRPSQRISGVNAAQRRTPTSHDTSDCHHGTGIFQRAFLITSCVKKNRPHAVHARTIPEAASNRLRLAALIASSLPQP